MLTKNSQPTLFPPVTTQYRLFVALLDVKPLVPLLMRIVKPINIQESMKIGPRWGLNPPPYDRRAAAHSAIWLHNYMNANIVNFTFS